MIKIALYERLLCADSVTDRYAEGSLMLSTNETDGLETDQKY